MATPQLLVRLVLLGNALALLSLGLLVANRHAQREERVAQKLLLHAQALAAAAAEHMRAAERQLQRLAKRVPADASQVPDFLQDAQRVQQIEGVQVMLTTLEGDALMGTAEPTAPGQWADAAPQAGLELALPVVEGTAVPYVLRAIVPPASLLGSGDQLPGGWHAAVADPQGRLQAGWPEPRATSALPADRSLEQSMRAGSSGVVEVRSADGGERLAAFSRIDPQGWTAVVSAPRMDLYAPVWRTTALEALAAALLLSVAGGATLRSGWRTGTLLDRRLGEAQRTGVTSERRLRSLLSLSSDAIVISDARHRIVLANDAARRMFGSDGHSLVESNVAILFARETWARCQVQPGSALPVPGCGRRADGTTFPIEYTVSHFADGIGRLFRTMIVTDVSARREQDDALLAARGALLRMNHDFDRAVDREAENRQAAIARELHDAVGSSLAGVSLLLGTAYSYIREPRVATLISKAQEQVMQASQQVRQIARGIMPAGQDRGALLPALKQFAAELSCVPDVHCEVRSRGRFEDVPPEVGGHLFRIVQEATSNALRHGHALRVRITLAQAGSWCRLTVCDDGTGYDAATPAPLAEGMGLKSMRARAEAIGGRFSVVTVPGHSLKVQVTWLCSPA